MGTGKTRVVTELVAQHLVKFRSTGGGGGGAAAAGAAVDAAGMACRATVEKTNEKTLYVAPQVLLNQVSTEYRIIIM